jgi:hypothetical protein
MDLVRDKREDWKYPDVCVNVVLKIIYLAKEIIKDIIFL